MSEKKNTSADTAEQSSESTLAAIAKKLIPKEIRAEKARRSFPEFLQLVQPRLSVTPFHAHYYEVLDRFARGDIRKLIVIVPPQHGKSLAATVLLPAYLLGKDPDLRMAVASYNLTQAARFNRQIQRIIDTKSYRAVFPHTTLKKPGSRENYLRTAEEFEVIGHAGGVIAVGREGALTGNPVDVMIIDDLYKDALEGNSPVVRDNAWEWYVSVVRTRLHNDSRELIVMTRWHDDDLIGRLKRREKLMPLDSPDEVNEKMPAKTWALLHFEALKTGKPTTFDPRSPGEALWPERQDKPLLQEKQALDPVMFECLYQGHPSNREGALYGDRFAVYTELPREIVRKSNYTDTADMGEDFLCSVCYEMGKEGRIYLTDLVYTQLGMEHTEEAVASMLERNGTRIAWIESNNGGRGFARNVSKRCKLTKIEGLTQSANKESRILTNQATVLKHIVMPSDWMVRWPEFHAHVTGYRRLFRANRFHDAADVLTGIVEKEIVNKIDKTVKKIILL